jgi:hypothetical protein
VARRPFDPAALRRQAVRFSRERYRSGMRALLEEAYAAHRRRHEDQGAVERPARDCARQQGV